MNIDKILTYIKKHQINIDIKQNNDEIIHCLFEKLFKTYVVYIIEIQVGSGGKDANDWTEMLFNLYIKFFIKTKIEYSIIDYNVTPEGLRCAVIRAKIIKNMLYNESGVHRLVRISPFNKNGKRQTSFASVRIYEEEIKTNIVIKDTDLKWQTFRSSGAGGQHVNTTDSAVRVSHIPTNITVNCQNERSQLQNKEQAMRILKKRIEMYYESQKVNTYEYLENITFGSQFRSYVLNPTQFIKDDRLNANIKSSYLVNKILNGDLDILLINHKYNMIDAFI